jgi:UDP-N-acetylmuramate--alanine ligase
LFDDFARSFYLADVLLVMPIYAASEQPIEGVGSRLLCDSIQAHGHKEVHFVDGEQAAVDLLIDLVSPADVVLTLGAGDVFRVGERLLDKLHDG